MTSFQTNVLSFKAAYYQLDNKPVNLAATRRDFYKIWLVLNRGTLTLEDVPVSIHQPSLVFLHPLTRYAFHPAEKKRSGYWCIFTGEFLDTVSKNQLMMDTGVFRSAGQVFMLNETVLPVITFYFQQIVKEYTSDYPFRFTTIRHLTTLLIHEGRKMQPATDQAQQQNAASRLALRFMNLMESQFPVSSPSEPIKLKKPADFASELTVHINHLNAVIQEVTGKSTRQMIADRIIHESKALLHYSDWPVADIAYSLGFEYPNHFTTFFKKKTGVTPLSLRL